jgi:hypothetical protein
LTAKTAYFCLCPQPLQDYFAASDLFLKRFWACYGGWPSDYTYRVWAVKTLMKLVNNATKPEPTVRQLGGTGPDAKARVITGILLR